jgi:hypothetical protein
MASKLTLLAQQRSSAQIEMMSKESFRWLATKIQTLKGISNIPAGIGREDFRHNNRFVLGGMYYFYYDPKGKDDLPYYDKFPLVLALEKYSDGFLGLNLHYLPIKYRVAFLGKLMDYAVYNRENEIKRVRVTYDILSASKRFKEFRPCIKRYLNSHVRSKILAVQPNEWDVATFLPVQQFKKATSKEVWEDSVQQIRNS